MKDDGRMFAGCTAYARNLHCEKGRLQVEGRIENRSPLLHQDCCESP
jgi:hypothetical protein